MRESRREERSKLAPLHTRLYDRMMSIYIATDSDGRQHPIIDHLGKGTAGDDRWYKVDEQGRVHTPVVCCPRDIRHRLRFQGVDEPLEMLDVKTCQPLLLGAFIHRLPWLAEVEPKPTLMNRADSTRPGPAAFQPGTQCGTPNATSITA